MGSSFHTLVVSHGRGEILDEPDDPLGSEKLEGLFQLAAYESFRFAFTGEGHKGLFQLGEAATVAQLERDPGRCVQPMDVGIFRCEDEEATPLIERSRPEV